VETETTLDFKAWDAFIEGLIQQSGRDAVLTLVSNDKNLPTFERARDLALEQTERFPIRSLVTNIVVTDDTINVVANRDEYLEREARRNYGLDASMRFVYLGRAMRMARKGGHFDAARVQEALSESELFSGRDTIWSCAIERYFADDFISFQHIMLPQIEQAVRSLVRAVGRRVTVTGRDGQMELKNLGALLASLRDLVDNDLARFLEFVLCHRQGWNLRNAVSHGVAEQAVFSPQLSGVVLWIALRLSLIRVTVGSSTGGAEAASRQTG
jgi:hypothetical protein